MKHVDFANARKSDVLRSVILHSIQSGEYQPGNQLPTEYELIERFRVSRTTVREAVASLVHEGLLQKIQGKGTFISERRLRVPSFAIVMPYLFCTDLRDFGAGADVIPLMVQAIENECRADQAKMVLMLDNQEALRERENLRSLADSDMDAVILYYIGGDENLDCLRALVDDGPPVLLIDRYCDDVPTDCVVTDNAAGAEAAVAQLEAAGYTEVFFVTTPVVNTSLRDRLEGYVRAMECRCRVPRVLTIEQALALTSESRSAPIAILTSEAGPLGTIWKRMSADGCTPSGLAVACFDEPYIHFPPNVTVVKVIQPLEEMGRLSINLAKDAANAREVPGAHERRTYRNIQLLPSLQAVGCHTGWQTRRIRLEPNQCSP